MEIAEWCEKVETEAEECGSRPEAEQILSDYGLNCRNKSTGELMCWAA